jgi:hypothetical protein
MYLLRIFLIFVIIYLLVRAFFIAGYENKKKDYNDVSGTGEKDRKKGVPRELGEYVDFEEIEKDS